MKIDKKLHATLNCSLIGRVVVGRVTGDIDVTTGTFVNATGLIVGFRVMGVSVAMGDVVGISVVTRIGGLVGGVAPAIVEVVFGVGVMRDTGLLEIMIGDDAGPLLFNCVDGEVFELPLPQFPAPQ